MGMKGDVQRILVIFTGGTIGSRANGGVIDIDGQAGYELLERYHAMAGAGRGAEVRFETLQPYQVLSENMNPAHWQSLIRCIEDADPPSYSGIIVTHGSDTLSYTAAALSYALADIQVPLLLVAANYPLEDERSNGLRNFAAAVDFIRTSELRGVYAAFENDRGDMPIYLGTRLIEAAPFTDQFAAPYDAPLGHMEAGAFVPYVHEVNPPLAELARSGGGSAGTSVTSGEALMRQEGSFTRSRTHVEFSTDVLFIRPYPGLDYSWYDWAGAGAVVRKPAAVLHGLYHSATASGENAEQMREASFMRFAARCAEQGVDLYVAPAKAETANRYGSAEVGTSAGGMPLRKITVEAALVKLMLAYGTYSGDAAAREAFLKRSVFFEFHEGGEW